jgi:hypothetical protein
MNGPSYPQGTDIANPLTAPIDASVSTVERPALAYFNYQTVTGFDPGKNSYGDDLFAVITASVDQGVNLINASRAIFEKEVLLDFKLYDSQSTGLDPECRPQSDPLAPVPLNSPGADGRAILTEIGYANWVLPTWFMSGKIRLIARNACEKANPSGRFDPPCGEARYPIILKPQGSDFSCSGSWLNHGTLGFQGGNVFHEIMHSLLTNILGIRDDGSAGTAVPPTQADADRSGIARSDLVDAFGIFGTSTNADCLDNSLTDKCPDTGREPGFTADNANNYSMSTRQHAFIYAIEAYVAEGANFRSWSQTDLAAGNDLLQRKYNWIRDHVYRGKEF